MLAEGAFYVVAAVLLVAASRAVTAVDLVHAVLWLGVTLASTAVVFILLGAHFLAAMQIILYTGGVLTLMLFGVMLTRREPGARTVISRSHRRGAGVLLAISVAALLGGAITRTRLPAVPPAGAQVDTRALGVAVLTEYALAFEVLSVLLLGVTLGAIVLGRRRDAGDEAGAVISAIPARRPLPLQVGGTR